MNADSCCVCFEECSFFTECDHCLCVNCYNSFDKFGNWNTELGKFTINCPICRRIMEGEPEKQKTIQELKAELKKYKEFKKENEKLKKENERLKEINTNLGEVIDVKNEEIKDLCLKLTKTPASASASTPAQTQQNISTTYSKKKPAGNNASVPTNVLLGDLPFNDRPRLLCMFGDCQRKTRRVCSKCRAVRACQGHDVCGAC